MNFIRSAFRTVRENPALIFGEIAWRWSFGAAAWILVLLTVRTIMEGIDVSAAEVAMARSSDAFLIADALVRILLQVLPRLANATLVVVPALSVLWIVAATIGRAATLSAIQRGAGFQPAVPLASSRRIYSLVSINAIRAIFTVATVLAFFGTVILVSAQFTPDLAPMLVLAWLCLAFVVGLFWGIVNWFLALAPIFVVRDGSGVGTAISASLGLYRDCSRPYMAIATWFGFFRGTALLFAIIAGSVAVATGSVRLALTGSILVALAYFAVADYLYIARLAAFVALAALDAQVAADTSPLPPPAPTPENQNLKLETET